ncbi:rhombosortase [Paraglaciecola sp. L1A13]|uniref:rhombosortase n=1 Tax=Paraglaciecola sp. L1A13 TaxID=2686359 RepID=UPI00131CC9AD|nr:rhombosortase [Paraglaciecola sp. L1A13]
MLRLPYAWTHSLGPILVCVIATMLYIAEPTSNMWLAFDRDSIGQGEWWRLLTGNFLHTNLNHLLLNLAAVVLLWTLHGQYYQTLHYLMMICICGIAVSTGIYYLDPQLQWYVGLSGVLHGIFVWGAYQDIKHGLVSGWILMAGVWAKIANEQIAGASNSVAVLIDANVAINAHLFGAFCGLVMIICALIKQQKNN